MKKLSWRFKENQLVILFQIIIMKTRFRKKCPFDIGFAPLNLQKIT